MVDLGLDIQSKQTLKHLDCWSRGMLNIYFLQKDLGLVYPPYFVYNVLRKIYLTLYSINWPKSIVCLPLLLEILGNMCVQFICYTLVWDVTNFGINFSSLIKPFFYITKKSGKKCKYLKNVKNFWHETKNIFHQF